jgi:polar amino acid transport system ATP-binding protein
MNASAKRAQDPAARPVLDVQAVHKRFGDQPVLRGIDLTVDRHEVVVLIGASGSGKSTLLKTINLLEQVDDGRIFLGDEDITDPRVDTDRVRARIGVVFQHYNLFPHMNVLDNVTLAARKVFGTARADAERTGLALLARIGLADKAKEYPDRLSGGQQQRVAIARAIATDPELLLLDEITSALDPQLVGEVLDRDGDARDVVRATGRRPRGLPEGRRHHRVGAARADLRPPPARGDAGVLVPRARPLRGVNRRARAGRRVCACAGRRVCACADRARGSRLLRLPPTGPLRDPGRGRSSQGVFP